MPNPQSLLSKYQGFGSPRRITRFSNTFGPMARPLSTTRCTVRIPKTSHTSVSCLQFSFNVGGKKTESKDMCRLIDFLGKDGSNCLHILRCPVSFGGEGCGWTQRSLFKCSRHKTLRSHPESLEGFCCLEHVCVTPWCFVQNKEPEMRLD